MITVQLVNYLPEDNILDKIKLKAFANDKFKLAQVIDFSVVGGGDKGWKTLWEKGKMRLPAFSPFLTFFSQKIRVVESRDCLVKS